MPDPTYVIESADPADWNGGQGGKTMYPWKELLVGQLFTVPAERASKLSFKSFKANVSHMGKRYGRKFGLKRLENGSWQVVRLA